MKIAVLSDTRLPTNISYPGHGLGRSLWRIATGLAARGHAVTVYAGPGSRAPGCELIIDSSELERAERLAKGKLEYDAILDGTHQHNLAHIRGDWPIVCKRADREGRAPNRRVYGGATLVAYCDDPGGGVVIEEGIDVENIPFNGGRRNGHLLYVSTAAWKRADMALEISRLAGVPILFMGECGMPEQMRALSGHEYYRQLASAMAVLSTVGTMSTLEAAATGTPSITVWKDDSWVEHGVSGWCCDSVAAAASCVGRELDPFAARQWVEDCRSIKQMCIGYERVLERAANGEVW